MGTIVYLDTETGGLRPEHSTLQIGMVCQRAREQFMSYVQADPLVVDPAALAYNKLDLRGAGEWPHPNVVAIAIGQWVRENDLELPLVACGFNVRFDVERANEIWRGLYIVGDPLFSHRCLDLTAVALFHGLPAKSIELMDWAGVPREPDERHDALADARKAMLVHLAMQERLIK